MSLFTRVAFCEKCFKAGKPHYGDQFLIYGGSSEKFYIEKAQSNGTKGFTPHLITLIKVENQEVVYDSSCCICDVDIWEEGDIIKFEVFNSHRGIIPIKEWNAWLRYKNDKDYQI